MTIVYNSNYHETMPFSDTTYQVGLVANSQQSFTVPGTDLQQYQALFSYNALSNVWVRKNGVPTTPPGGTVGTQPYSEFRPEKRYVRGGDVLYFISPDPTSYVGVSLRQIQG